MGKFVSGGEEVTQMEGVGDTYDARNGCGLFGGSPFQAGRRGTRLKFKCIFILKTVLF